LTLAFGAGASTATVTVTPINDNIAEGSETVTLTIASGTGYTVVGGAATGTIADNDTAALSIGNATVTEGDKGTANYTIPVTLSNPSTQTITVVATTVAGTATAGSDFVQSTSTLTFAPGVTSVNFTFGIVGDTVKENTETFTIQLSSPTGGATLGNGSGTITIIDNDGAMLGAEDPPAGTAPIDRPLTSAALAPVLAQAEAMWRAVDPSADFGGYSISIGDLPGSQLGWTDGGRTTIDATADGFGWSVMYPGSAGRMDLLTVLLHELGRVLGLTTDDAGRYPVMTAALSPGERLPLVRRASLEVATTALEPAVAQASLIGPLTRPWITGLPRLQLIAPRLGNHAHITTRQRRA
jgi:hypothetical protein